MSSIPHEIAATVDDYHITKLYCVCRFCFTRVKLRGAQTKRPAPSQQLCERAKKYYQIDLKRELINVGLPKVLCNACTSRLGDFEKGALDYTSWNKEKRHFYDKLAMDNTVMTTRASVICSKEKRCKVCSIAAKRLSNETIRSKSDTPKPGRPEKHSPVKDICSRCGRTKEEHKGKIDKLCKMALKRPHAAGKIFAERIKARKYTGKLVAERLQKRFTDASVGSQPSTLPSGVSVNSNEFLGLCPVPYKPQLKTTRLSEDGARDLLRLGHLGLGQKGARELCKILRREGVHFPEGGLKRAWEERWEIFGHLFRPEKLLMQSDSHADPTATPFGVCVDVESLLNVVTSDEADRITRLKLQFDGGQQFLKLSVNIVTMEPMSKYIPSPNSVLKNFVIVLGEGAETRHNLQQIFDCEPINKLFDLDMPKQIACDLKVSAMLVGIQMASCKYPCPFCTSTRDWSDSGADRSWDRHMKDLKNRDHSVVSQPVVRWEKSPLEVLSVSPLHLMLGIVNKLYSCAKPGADGKGTLYKKHCKALLEQNIRRSDYFDGALEGNSCSRLLDAVAKDLIPFSPKVTAFVDALKAFHDVKQNCLGVTRKRGWRQSIKRFGVAWDSTHLASTLKVHIVRQHVAEYLLHYESVPDAGLGLSSEQSGEALHSRLQRIWNLRFKVTPENKVFPNRLVDCMVSYNWNLKWDEARRLSSGSSGGSDTSESDSDGSSGEDELLDDVLNSDCQSETLDQGSSKAEMYPGDFRKFQFSRKFPEISGNLGN